MLSRVPILALNVNPVENFAPADFAPPFEETMAGVGAIDNGSIRDLVDHYRLNCWEPL